MNDSLKQHAWLLRIVLLILGVYFLFRGLHLAASFFVPLFTGILLAMLMVPVSDWLEKKGLARGWSITISVFIIIIFFGIIMGLLGMQIANLMEDWPQLKENIVKRFNMLADIVAKNTPISREEFIKNVEQQISAIGGSGNQAQQGSAADNFQGFLSAVFSTLGDIFLIIIYIIMFLLYREKFGKFIVKMSPKDRTDDARDVSDKASKVAQQYLFGRFILMAVLAVLYTISLLLIGVKYAVFFAILAALLSIIPYIGNIIGGAFPVLMSLVSGGGIMTPLLVIGAFTIIQLIESYLLEPVIVGEKVDMNPLFVVLSVIVGGIIWGIPGMIIATPILGIFKIICDHVQSLKPIGYLIGDTSSDDKKYLKKIKEKLK